MGLTRGASSAAANSPPNKKVKKVYNTNEQYDPTPMTSYAKRTGHPQVFDPVVPVYPEDCMYGKKGEPTQQMYNHVLGSVCNRLALRENFAECTLETQPDFKVCAPFPGFLSPTCHSSRPRCNAELLQAIQGQHPASLQDPNVFAGAIGDAVGGVRQG